MKRLASDPDLRDRLGRRAKLRSSMFDIAEANRAVGDIYLQVSRVTVTALAGKRARPRHHGRHESRTALGPAAPSVRRRRHGSHRRVGSRPVRHSAGIVGHPPRAPPSCHPVHSGRPGPPGTRRALEALPTTQARHRPHAQPQTGGLRTVRCPSGRGARHCQHRAWPLRQPGGSARPEVRGVRPRTSRCHVLGSRAGPEPRGSCRSGPPRRTKSQARAARQRSRACSASFLERTTVGNEPGAISVSTSDAVVVGMVARLVWQKGFRELFAAAEMIRDTPSRGRLSRCRRLGSRQSRRDPTRRARRRRAPGALRLRW